jgi:hypothetical protein
MGCIADSELARWAAGEATSEAGAAHLAGCSRCQARLAQLRDGLASTHVSGPKGAQELAQTQISGGPAAGALPAGLDLPRGTGVGRYLVLERVGRGGMGEVYAAYDPELHRKVALKMLLTGAAEEPSREFLRTRLVREAQAMARLAHPNVVAVYDVGTHAGQVFVAMEFVDGQTLTTWLAETPRPWREVLSLFVPAGRGLAAAHAAGLIHRDFKPDNVLVGRDGRPRVTDFGLAHLGADGASGASGSAPPERRLSLTSTGELLGTPAYMAPEQFAGKAADARTDQFNFCAALYEALYGQRPFAGESFVALAQAVTRGEVRPAPRGSPVPPWLRAEVLRGLSLRAEDRHPSMEALLAAVDRDPAARTRRVALALGAVVCVGVTAAFPVRAHLREATRCAREAEAFATAWTAEREAGLVAALSASGPAGPLLAKRTVDALRRYNAQLTEVRRGVCEAERSGSLTVAAAQLQRDCQSRDRGDFLALVQLLTEPGQKDQVDAQVAELSPPEGCNELRPNAALDPELDAPFQPDIARARFLVLVGRVDEASKLLDRVEVDAQAAGATRTRAMAAYLRAEVLRMRGATAEVLAALDRSENLAEAAGDDAVVGICRVNRVTMLGTVLNRYDEAERAAAQARATLSRLAGYTILEARLDRFMGNMAVNRGQREAIGLLERSVAANEQRFGQDSTELSWPLNDLGRAVAVLDGDFVRAQALFERAAEIWKAGYGPDAIALATFWDNAANAALSRGDDDVALKLLDGACAVAEKHLDDHSSDLADLLVTRAGIELESGKLAAARKDLERASTLHVPTFDSTSIADLELKLAELSLREGHPEAALPHARRALEQAQQRPGETDLLAGAQFALAKALPPARRPEALAQARAALHTVTDPDSPMVAELHDWLAAHGEGAKAKR